MKAILCPEGHGRYALEVYTDAGDWWVCLHHDATRTFFQDYEVWARKAVVSKEDDLAIREQIHKAYHTLYPHNNA